MIVDDHHVPMCAESVHDQRAKFGIAGPIQDIDGLGVYWRREASAQGLEQRK